MILRGDLLARGRGEATIHPGCPHLQARARERGVSSNRTGQVSANCAVYVVLVCAQHVKTGATLSYPHFASGYWEHLPPPARNQRREAVQLITVRVVRYRLDSVLQRPTPRVSCQ